MKTKEFIYELERRTGVPGHVCKRVVRACLALIVESVCVRGRVGFVNFGVFESVIKKETVGRNPRTGERVPIPEQQACAVQAGKGLQGGSV